MHILLSNDDGYLAPGIACLAEHLKSVAEITVVAPERDRSGASNSLTLTAPLRVHRGANGFYYVDGTPTDCVHLAITGILPQDPDIVIAGINRGANLGDDVIYSGTVAAAMEGRFMGLPALAVSVAGRSEAHYATAARITLAVLMRLRTHPLPSDTLLNINVPDVPWTQLSGMEVTRLGHRHKAEPVVRSQDPHGNPIYWVGAPGAEADAGPGTDFHALRHGRVSITPLQVDLTRHTMLQALGDWVQALGA